MSHRTGTAPCSVLFALGRTMKYGKQRARRPMRKVFRWLGIRGGIALVLGAPVAALTGNALYGLAAGGVVMLVAVNVEIFFYLDREIAAHGGIHWEGSRAHAAHAGMGMAAAQMAAGTDEHDAPTRGGCRFQRPSRSPSIRRRCLDKAWTVPSFCHYSPECVEGEFSVKFAVASSPPKRRRGAGDGGDHDLHHRQQGHVATCGARKRGKRLRLATDELHRES